MEYKVAIISSIYNKEKYLKKMIDSLVNQTYKNLEIILVDNGSIDDSWNIIKEYSKYDSRIIAIHLEKNLGQSGGLNEAMKHITAPYFTEIDSDDWIEQDCISTIVASIKNNPDFTIWRYKEVFENNQIIPETKFVTGNLNVNDPKKFMLIHLLNQESNYGNKIIKEIGTPWMKLYKTSVVSGIIHNPSFSFFEDYLWNVKAILKSDSFFLVDYIGYNLRRGEDSYTNNFTLKKVLEIINAYDSIKGEIFEYLKDTEVECAFFEFSFRCAIPMFYVYMETNKKIFFDNVPKKTFLELKKVFKKKLTSNIFNLKSIFKYFVFVNRWKLLYKIFKK